MERHTSFEISWPALWRILIFIVLIAVFYLGHGAFGVLLIGIIISLALDPAVSFLERRKIPRILGTLVLFFAGFSFFSAAIYFLIPIFSFEVGLFLEHFNKTISYIFGLSLPQAFIKNFGLSLNQALSFVGASNFSITGALGAVFSKIVFFIASLVVSFYLTAEKDGAEKFLKMILPDIYERPVLAVFHRFKLKIGHWIAAQLFLSLIVGLVVGIGLWLFGVPYALVLGLLAGIFELVPMIGPVITGTIAFLAAVSESFSLGVVAVVFFIVVQQLENHILIPNVMSRAFKVHPVMVVVALLAGSQIAGFAGLLLAVPMAVLAQEIFSYLAEQKNHRHGLGI